MSLSNYPSDELNIQFCEARWGGIFRGKYVEEGIYLPEIGNCISSIFIIFMGIHMLIFWIHPSGLLRLISATFVINGISSFLYHYTNRSSWLHIDGTTMLFIAWMILAYVFEEFIQITEYNQSYYLLNNILIRIVVGLFWCLACGVGWWMIGKAPLNGKLYGETLFDMMFIIPLVLSIGSTFYMIKYYKMTKIPYLNQSVEKKARGRFIFGVIIIMFSSSLWVVTEKLCDTVDFFKLFPGHMLWHVIVAWGMSNCLLYASLLRADDFHMRASLNIGSINFKKLCSLRSIIYSLYSFCSCKSICVGCSNLYFFIFPSFKFHAYQTFSTPTTGTIHV